MVDVVRFEHGPEEFLHLVGILVDAPGAADAGHGVGSVLFDDPLELRNDQVQSLVPGRLPELAVFLTDQGGS